MSRRRRFLLDTGSTGGGPTPPATAWVAGSNTTVTPGDPVEVSANSNDAFRTSRLVTGLTPAQDYIATCTVVDTGGLSLYIVVDDEPELAEGVFGFTQVIADGPASQEFTAPASGEVYVGFYSGGSGGANDSFSIAELLTVVPD